MKRLSRIFSRDNPRQSPKRTLPRDETQEEILMRSDESDTEKDATDGNKTTSVDHNGSNKERLISTVSAATSLASVGSLVDRETAKKFQEALFEAAGNDDVDRLKAALKAMEEHNSRTTNAEKQQLSLEQPDLCDPETRMTVLHFALDQKKLRVAQFLIECQTKALLTATYINISKQIPPSRKSCVHQVAELGDFALFDQLLQKLAGIDVNAKFADNWLKAQVADFKHEQVVEKFDVIGKRRVSALHMAAIKGHCALIKPLLSYGFDIDLEDSERETPLSLAVQMGQLDTAKELLDSKASVDHANAYGCTPLHLAISLDKKDMVRLLAEDGKADVNLERINPFPPDRVRTDPKWEALKQTIGYL